MNDAATQSIRLTQNPAVQAGSLRYRADIDGLRCVAVLLVVVFHACPDVLTGGFIGVDVFFVISGFLISSLIFQDLKENGFSYRRFYARRVRRIFPALLTVLLASWVAGWFILLPPEFASLGKSIAGGAAFVSNFVLFGETGYFDIAADRKPLLHLWSLGIEEQFYILWPLLLVTAHRYGANLLVLTALLVAASFALNVLRIGAEPVATFYLPLTRCWELLAGGLLAWTAVHGARMISQRQKDRFAANKVLPDIVAALGLALILGAAIALDKADRFPGGWALLPVAGAILVIVAPGSWLNRRLLAHPLMVGIGLISYPLYLWHWPLLAFARILTEPGSTSPLILLAAVAISFVLAWLTYVAIEKPVLGPRGRAAAGMKPRPSGPASVVALCGAMAVMAGIGLLTINRSGFTSRFPQELRFVFEGEMLTQPFAYSEWRNGRCFINAHAPDWKFADECVDPDRRPLILFWGSSAAASLYPGLRSVQASNRFGLAQFTATGCNPTLTWPVEAGASPYCKDINAFVMSEIIRLQPDVVAMHATWDNYNIQFLDETIAELRKHGIRRIVLIGREPVWQPPNGLPGAFAEYYSQNPDRPLLPERTHFQLPADNIIYEAATRAKARELSLEYISVWDVFCNQEGCLTRVGSSSRNDLTTYDTFHLSPAASRFLANAIIARLLGRPR